MSRHTWSKEASVRFTLCVSHLESASVNEARLLCPYLSEINLFCVAKRSPLTENNAEPTTLRFRCLDGCRSCEVGVPYVH